MEKFDFTGWATRHNVKCSDGRIILKDAFKHNDGQKVPLVWNHQHDDPNNVLGYAILHNHDEGVRASCKFNDTEQGQTSKLIVEHGDVVALSIYANQLKQEKGYVQHGNIREVSLVLAGANPGAYIDSINLSHGEGSEEEAIMSFIGINMNSDEDFDLTHAEEQQNEKESDEKEKPMAEEVKTGEKAENEKTVQEVFDEFNEEQKTVTYALVGQAYEDGYEAGKNDANKDSNNNNEEGDKDMKHNAFDKNTQQDENVISHSEMTAIINDAKKCGSIKEAALAHGMTEIGYLYPYGEEDGRLMTNTPQLTGVKNGWVQKVKNAVHHVPFSRIKALFADISAEEARARGYIKGKQKKEEVFALLKRTTSPQTIYKLQKMDRDDVIDITDFDVIAFLKNEMRIKLDEEIARAILVGDGRLPDEDDKIKEEHVRPIWTDEDLYAIHSTVNVEAGATLAQIAEEFIDECVRSREDYDGSGSPTAYMPESLVSACLLLKDKMGHRIYKDVKELATAMLVNEIVSVPAMKNLTRTDKEGKTRTLRGIIVNLEDYTVGADKGGAVNMFDDFDINFNKYEYLIETRASGALMKPKSAIVLETVAE